MMSDSAYVDASALSLARALVQKLEDHPVPNFNPLALQKALDSLYRVQHENSSYPFERRVYIQN